MALTYEPIATTTLSATTTAVTFSSIPGTYTDLILVVNCAVATTNNIRMRFNSDSSAVYSSTFLYGTASAAGSARIANTSSSVVSYYGDPTTTLGNSNQIIHIFNYANTTTNKTSISRANQAGQGVDANVQLWRSTAAITSVTLIVGFAGTTNFNSGSIFTLYGIKAA